MRSYASWPCAKMAQNTTGQSLCCPGPMDRAKAYGMVGRGFVAGVGLDTDSSNSWGWEEVRVGELARNTRLLPCSRPDV